MRKFLAPIALLALTCMPCWSAVSNDGSGGGSASSSSSITSVITTTTGAGDEITLAIGWIISSGTPTSITVAPTDASHLVTFTFMKGVTDAADHMRLELWAGHNTSRVASNDSVSITLPQTATWAVGWTQNWKGAYLPIPFSASATNQQSSGATMSVSVTSAPFSTWGVGWLFAAVGADGGGSGTGSAQVGAGYSLLDSEGFPNNISIVEFRTAAATGTSISIPFQALSGANAMIGVGLNSASPPPVKPKFCFPF